MSWSYIATTKAKIESVQIYLGLRPHLMDFVVFCNPTKLNGLRCKLLMFLLDFPTLQNIFQFIYNHVCDFSSREPPSPCKNHSLINNGECDLVNFNDECNFDGKDCCPNPSAIGNGVCNLENNIRLCNYDGGDCCTREKIMDGNCDLNHLNRMCNYDGGDCTCDYKNLTRDGHCNLVNNKSICLFDDFDCVCPNSTLVDGMYIDCDGKISFVPYKLK